MTRRSRTAGMALAGALLLGACSGDDQPPDPPASSAPPSGPATPETGAVSDEVIERASRDREVVATADGQVEASGSGGSRVPATVAVVAVVVSPTSTVLTWQVSTDQETRVDPLAFASGPDLGRPVTDGVQIADSAANQLLTPSSFDKGRSAPYCTCSDTPASIGPEPQLLWAQYPALPAGTREVEVRIPGFPPLASVPVTRQP